MVSFIPTAEQLLFVPKSPMPYWTYLSGSKRFLSPELMLPICNLAPVVKSSNDALNHVGPRLALLNICKRKVWPGARV